MTLYVPAGVDLMPQIATQRVGHTHYFDVFGVLRTAVDDQQVPSLGGVRSDAQHTSIVGAADYRNLTAWLFTGSQLSPEIVTLLDTAQTPVNAVRETTTYGRHGVAYLFDAVAGEHYSISVGVQRGGGARNVCARVLDVAQTRCMYDGLAVLDSVPTTTLSIGESIFADRQSMWSVLYLTMRCSATAQYSVQLLSTDAARNNTTDYMGDGTSGINIDWLTISNSRVPALPVQGQRTRYPTRYSAAIPAAPTTTYWVSVRCVLHYDLSTLSSHALLYIQGASLSVMLVPVAGVSAAIVLRNSINNNYIDSAQVSGVIPVHGLDVRVILACVDGVATAAVRVGDSVYLLRVESPSAAPTLIVLGEDHSATYDDLRYGSDALTSAQMLAMLDVGTDA